VRLPITTSNAGLQWIRAEAEQASGLDAMEDVPEEIDFYADSVVRVSRARGRNVLATRRELEWAEVHYMAVAISADADVAREAQEAIEAALHDRFEEPGPDGTTIAYCEAVDAIAYTEGEGSNRVYFRGVEFAVKVRPAS
jgi:hypothetical protein